MPNANWTLTSVTVETAGMTWVTDATGYAGAINAYSVQVAIKSGELKGFQTDSIVFDRSVNGALFAWLEYGYGRRDWGWLHLRDGGDCLRRGFPLQAAAKITARQPKGRAEPTARSTQDGAAPSRSFSLSDDGAHLNWIQSGRKRNERLSTG
ncbi:hypothetical protein PG995_010752 [Apiospora arundinis]